MPRRCTALALALVTCLLTRSASGQQSTEEAVRAAIVRYVASASRASNQEVAVECGPIQGSLRQYVAVAESLYARPTDGAGTLAGKKLFVVEAMRGGVVLGRGQVLATIRRFAEVVVARRLINRHELLSVADVGLEWREVKATEGSPILRVGDVLGKRTRRIIRRDQILRAEDLELPPLVRRGDLVTMLVDAKNLTIAMKVQALQDGTCGQRIPVRAVDSRTRYMAEVKEPGLVVLRP